MVYRTIIFDCDGVVLNSNELKTDVFRAVTSTFGDLASSALVDYHRNNGGISRYAKFEYFADSVLPKYSPDFIIGDRSDFLCKLSSKFSLMVRERLMKCEVAPRLVELRRTTSGARWVIVSGGDQAELREVFDRRGLSTYFDGGIYGSPKNKHLIISDLLKDGDIQRPALFIGDSRLDFEVAVEYNLDFVFLSEWTEFDAWRELQSDNGFKVFTSIGDILDSESFSL